MTTLLYPDTSMSIPMIGKQLHELYHGLDLNEDPYVLYLRSSPEGQANLGLSKVFLSGKTNCVTQIRRLYDMALEINGELGPWPCQYYICSCIRRYQSHPSNIITGTSTLEEQEKAYLLRKISSIDLSSFDENMRSDKTKLTAKLSLLVDLLEESMKPNFACIVFARTRATVTILSAILSGHPKTKDNLRVGTFVGTSNHHGKPRFISDLSDASGQDGTLDDLRSGKKNLIISTSVCEEGIDITACNMVICFDRPPNLKSFIQRRGRARSVESSYVIMLPEGSRALMEEWQELEEKMKEVYMDDLRQLEEISEELGASENARVFDIPRTGYVCPISTRRTSCLPGQCKIDSRQCCQPFVSLL